MAYLKKWSWENTWLIYSIFAYLLLPWPFALLTVPKLFSTFAAVPHETILRTLVLGFVWGLAVVLYGLGVDMLGLALGTAIILGLGTSVGSLVPLIGQHREKLWAPSGIATLCRHLSVDDCRSAVLGGRQTAGADLAGAFRPIRCRHGARPQWPVSRRVAYLHSLRPFKPFAQHYVCLQHGNPKASD